MHVKTTTNTLADALQCVFDPRLYQAIEDLCVQAIASSNNHEPLRGKISNLLFQMKATALIQFGHDTADCAALARLMDRTNPEAQRQYRMACDAPKRRDPLAMLENNRALDADQLSAANITREVWQAFGRFLQISGRSYDGAGGGNRSKALQPMDVMGQDVYEKWQNLYRPWTEASKGRSVPRKRGLGKIYPEKILFDILIEHHYPDEVDKRLNLVPGSALRCLKQELKLMMDPMAIERAEGKLRTLDEANERRGMPTAA